LYQCKTHGHVNCGACFNWAKFIIQNEKKKEKGLVEDSELVLRLLRAMEVEFPPNYKPSADVLERKLRVALDLSQNIKSLKISSINPDKLPLWKVWTMMISWILDLTALRRILNPMLIWFNPCSEAV
jgi:hypothetical protein